jgi:hypothetical protein
VPEAYENTIPTGPYIRRPAYPTKAALFADLVHLAKKGNIFNDLLEVVGRLNGTRPDGWPDQDGVTRQ